MNPTYPLIATNPPDTVQDNRLISSRTSSSTTNLSSTVNLPPNEIIKERETSLPVEMIGDNNCSTLSTFIQLKEFFYDIFSLIKHLLLNLRFMGITCCAIVEALLIKGYLAFLSKHIEYQFRTTASHSSVYIGVISLFSVKYISDSFSINKLFLFSSRLFLAHH